MSAPALASKQVFVREDKWLFGTTVCACKHWWVSFNMVIMRSVAAVTLSWCKAEFVLLDRRFLRLHEDAFSFLVRG